jgi:DNA recombination protein Rad52
MATTLFSSEQIAALSAPLDRAKVQTRSQAGRSLSYMEGWQAIAEANRIFGFDGWQRETIAVTCVAERERTLGSSSRAGWGVTYTARVRIRVGEVIREGSGAGHGIDADLGQAHESAIKEAETDAMKRALMTFGNPFGLALYDKQQREVTSAPSRHPGSSTARQQLGNPDPEPAVELGLEPLDPATIQTILSTVRGLPKPALEGFTKAFRKRFQVPADAPSIADRICQRRHRDWIEAFLVSHREVRSGHQNREVRSAVQHQANEAS